MDFIGTGVTPPASPILQGGFADLASFIIRLVTVIGGLFATWNFVAAGYRFMNAGDDPEAITKAWGSIWKSLIGLLLIVASFVFAAFIGWIFLGSPTAIIAPDFSTTPPVVAPTTPPAATNTPVPTPTYSAALSGSTITIVINPRMDSFVQFKNGGGVLLKDTGNRSCFPIVNGLAAFTNIVDSTTVQTATFFSDNTCSTTTSTVTVDI